MVPASRVVVSFVLASSALIAIVSGCNGQVVGRDLTQSKPDPTEPKDPNDPTDPRKCTTIAAVCDPGDTQYAGDKECTGSGNAYCYTRADACGQRTIWCGHPDAQCDGLPNCDPGDNEVSVCPGGPQGPGTICYPRETCGTTILCFHKAECTDLPKCDPGDKEIFNVGLCGGPVTCYTRKVCGLSITCATP